jgi:hypothetical protein
MNRRSGLLACAGIVALTAGAAWVEAAPTRGAGTQPHTRGYVAADFVWAAYDGDQAVDCPEGLTLSPVDSFIALLPPAERAKVTRPSDLGEQVRMVAGNRDYQAAQRHNACTNPAEFPAYTGYRTITHRGAALGLDLDGIDASREAAAAPGTCAHDDFAGGIDNQLWRVMGCVKGLRYGGDALRSAGSFIRQGGSNTLIEITGIDDDRNDPDVTVGLYVGADPVALNAAGEVLPGASLHVRDEPRYQTVLKGRIKDGVLTTDPGTVTTRRDAPFEAPNDLVLQSARLRLELKPDGTASGLLAGYYDVDHFYNGAIRVMTQAGAQSLGYPCQGLLDQMHRLADGHPDPATGKCTAISAAWEVHAVPAFVLKPKPTAAAEAGGGLDGLLRRIGLKS